MAKHRYYLKKGKMQSKVGIVALFVFSLVLAFIAIIFIAGRGYIYHEETLVLPEKTISIEVANSTREREQGLSGKVMLRDDEGMLFVFDTLGSYSFWMKDMLFPIDIVWINEEGVIVWKEENVATSTYPKSFVSTSDAKYVLELPALGAAKAGLYLGTEVPDVLRFR